MSLQIVIVVTLVLAFGAAPIKGTNRRLTDTDTTTTTTVPDGSPEDQIIKCGGCPCNNPCYSTSPPPPSSPPPPPPSPPPPKMPTPTPGLNCPPPPTGGGYALAPPEYIYITGPPGDVYPVNPYFSGAHHNFWDATPRLVMFGLLSVLIFY